MLRAALLLFLAASPRQQIREILHVPNPLPKLEAKVHSRFSPEPGINAERVSYQTEFGMRVPAIVYSPAGEVRKRPALIVVNGHGGDKYAWYAFYSGIAYARAGAVVLTYDPIGEGERNSERKSGTRAHDKLLEPEVMGRFMGGLMMTDVMQAVSYLSSRPDVDAKRIGAMGYSMGSFVLSLACAVETRLNACVLVGGGNLGPYWERSKPMCQAIPYRSLDFLGDKAAAILAMHASRGPTLIYNGTADTVVAMPTHGPDFFNDLRRRTIEKHGSEKNVFEFEFHPDTSHRPYFVTRPVALWLERRLDFPNWTEQQIREMPVTHISEWAKEKGVDMDRGYISEDREGGTPAIGTGIPGLSREDLSVLKDDEWQREKPRLVYESWVEQARKRL